MDKTILVSPSSPAKHSAHQQLQQQHQQLRTVSRAWMGLLLLLLMVIFFVNIVHADIVVDNEIIRPEEIFDFTYSEDSPVDWQTRNVTKYYCIYRSLWSTRDHPANFPQMARLSNVAMYTSTKQYLPWLQTRAVTVGVERLAEVRGKQTETDGPYANAKRFGACSVIRFDGCTTTFGRTC
jgi:hypothetical protein